MKSFEEVWPANCLSIYSFISILLAISTACLKSIMGKRTQYNFVGRVFLKTSNICGSWYPKRFPTCLILFTYASIVSTFSSKWNDLHTWNTCSLVLPILEYCCQNKFCKPAQYASMGLIDSYHSLASPIKVKQNLCTLTWSRNSWVSIQSFILSKCAYTSSSGLPAYLGLKWDQFNLDLSSVGTTRVFGKDGLRGGGSGAWLGTWFGTWFRT